MDNDRPCQILTNKHRHRNIKIRSRGGQDDRIQGIYATCDRGNPRWDWHSGGSQYWHRCTSSIVFPIFVESRFVSVRVQVWAFNKENAWIEGRDLLRILCNIVLHRCQNCPTLRVGLVRENVMNGYLLLMQFEKLDMSSFIFFSGGVATATKINASFK